MIFVDTRKRSTTIVIRTLNSASYLSRCLLSLSHQSLMPDNILIVDAGSSDDLYGAVLEFINIFSIRIIRNPELGYETGLNIGAAACKTDFVVFLSPDCFPHDSWLEKLVITQRVKNCAVVQGNEQLPLTNDIHRVIQSMMNNRYGMQGINFFNDTNTLYVVEKLLPLLPFVGKEGGEDTLMSMQYKSHGLTAYICYDAQVEHNKFETVDRFKARMKEHGRSSAEMFIKFPLIPRLYLNGYYWTLREVLMGLSKRDFTYLKVAWWRFFNLSQGFMNYMLTGSKY